MKSNDLLFTDLSTGDKKTFSGFRDSLNGSLEYREVVAPASNIEAIQALLTAVVLKLPLTLLDAEASPPNFDFTGINANLDSHVFELIPGLQDEDALLVPPNGNGFKLTLLSSGTGGSPRSCTHDWGSLSRMLKMGAHHRSDVWGLGYSLTHIAGVLVALQAFYNRNPLVNLFRLGRAEIENSIKDYKITHISGTPTFYRQLIPTQVPIHSVRSVTLGGESVSQDLVEKSKRSFPEARIRNVYASTEAGPLLESNGECFRIPDKYAEVIRITNGRLLVHSSLVSDFDSDQAAFSDEWYDTGDSIEWAREGETEFRIVGRESDKLNVGGLNVSPREVEAVLEAFPGVAVARVSGRKNSVVGTILQAELVCSDTGLTEVELRAYASRHLPPAKVPRLISFVSHLPETRTGKIKRSE